MIFQAALQWAAAECKRRSLEVDSANCRTVMGDSLFLIRLPTMALEDFANEAAQSGILTLQETTDVFLYYTARNKPSLLYRYKKNWFSRKVQKLIFTLYRFAPNPVANLELD